MEETKNSLTERTLEVWQPRTRRVLTHEDARQIIENAVGFFSVLAEWDEEAGAGDSSPERGGELP